VKIQSFLLAATASLAITGAANAATLTGTFSTALFGVTSSTPAIAAGSTFSNAIGFVSSTSDGFAPITLGTVVNFAPVTATNGQLVTFTSAFGSFSGLLSNLATAPAPNAVVSFDSLGTFTPGGTLSAFASGGALLTVSFTQTGTLVAGRPAPSISGSWTLATTAVPEPASWAMLIAGFGLVGVASRRRRTTVVTA
jgi:hypothetical protein